MAETESEASLDREGYLAHQQEVLARRQCLYSIRANTIAITDHLHLQPDEQLKFRLQEVLAGWSSERLTTSTARELGDLNDALSAIMDEFAVRILTLAEQVCAVLHSAGVGQNGEASLLMGVAAESNVAELDPDFVPRINELCERLLSEVQPLAVEISFFMSFSGDSMLDEVGSQAAAQSEMLASSEMQEAMAAKLRALIVQMGLFFFKEKERIKTNLAVSELSPEIAKSIAAHQSEIIAKLLHKMILVNTIIRDADLDITAFVRGVLTLVTKFSGPNKDKQTSVYVEKLANAVFALEPKIKQRDNIAAY